MKTTAPINPELVAAKLAAIQNYEFPDTLDHVASEPRLVELLWFIQWHSMQPGGLRKFVSDFLNQFSDRIGTAQMFAIGQPERGIYTHAQASDIWENLPSYVKDKIAGNVRWKCDLYFEDLSQAEIEREQIARERDVEALIASLRTPAFCDPSSNRFETSSNAISGLRPLKSNLPGASRTRDGLPYKNGRLIGLRKEGQGNESYNRHCLRK